MPDLLVRLYDLPAHDQTKMEAQGIVIRRALTPERRAVLSWIEDHFEPQWASECATGFASHPVMTWIAVKDGEMLGFACGDATAKGFFGPTGVEEASRGKGVGHALLLASLLDLKTMGYAYAIIGDVGPSAFYERTVGAIQIPDSAPGIYAGLLQQNPD